MGKIQKKIEKVQNLLSEICNDLEIYYVEKKISKVKTEEEIE